MFWLLIVISVLAIGTTISWAVSNDEGRKQQVLAGLVSITIFISAWFTPQGKMLGLQFVATSASGNWLVVDNSGGKTLRHWILEDSFVQDSDKSDGYKFYDKHGNGPIYVSGDCFVMRISQPLDHFRAFYKERYNIPSDQPALE